MPAGSAPRLFEDYELWLSRQGEKDVDLLYQLGSVWAGWIQANGDDFVAIAELGRVKALMARIAELDETYDYGGPHLYLGVFETLVPSFPWWTSGSRSFTLRKGHHHFRG